MCEQWKSVEGFEGLYEVSNLGRVRSSYTGKILKTKPTPSGYLQVSLYRGGKQFTRYIHRLVALSFLANPHGKQEVNHLNGNKADNAVGNLQWATRAENVAHSFRQLGQLPANRKLSPATARRVRHSSATCRSLSKTLGVSAATISRIKTGDSYKEVI